MDVKLPSASTYMIMLSKDAVSWCFLSRRFSSFSFCFLRFLSAICFLLKVLLDFAIEFYSGSVSARMFGGLGGCNILRAGTEYIRCVKRKCKDACFERDSLVLIVHNQALSLLSLRTRSHFSSSTAWNSMAETPTQISNSCQVSASVRKISCAAGK